MKVHKKKHFLINQIILLRQKRKQLNKSLILITMQTLEAIYWKATIQLANEGNKEAMEKLQIRNKLRAEMGQPTIEEELAQMQSK
jgi:hypothetical protein